MGCCESNESYESEGPSFLKPIRSPSKKVLKKLEQERAEAHAEVDLVESRRKYVVENKDKCQQDTQLSRAAEAKRMENSESTLTSPKRVLSPDASFLRSFGEDTEEASGPTSPTNLRSPHSEGMLFTSSLDEKGYQPSFGGASQRSRNSFVHFVDEDGAETHLLSPKSSYTDSIARPKAVKSPLLLEISLVRAKSKTEILGRGSSAPALAGSPTVPSGNYPPIQLQTGDAVQVVSVDTWDDSPPTSPPTSSSTSSFPQHPPPPAPSALPSLQSDGTLVEDHTTNTATTTTCTSSNATRQHSLEEGLATLPHHIGEEEEGTRCTSAEGEGCATGGE